MKLKITVEGMMCEHCANAVKSALESVDGIDSVKVDLKKKSVKIKGNDNISDDAVKSAVADAGYTVTSIEV